MLCLFNKFQKVPLFFIIIVMEQPEYWHLDYRNLRKHLIGYGGSGELSAAAVLFFLFCVFVRVLCGRVAVSLLSSILLCSICLRLMFLVFYFCLLMSSSVRKNKKRQNGALL